MGKRYFFEVDYKCTCEVCGKEFYGLIKRGPLEYNGGILPTGMAGVFDAADMQLSKKLIESALNGTGNQPYIVENESICPNCGARQSWCPIKEPKKPGGIGGYFVAGIGGALLGMLVWLIYSFIRQVTVEYSMIPFILCLVIGAGLGLFLMTRSRTNHAGKAAEKYAMQKSVYDAYMDSLKTRSTFNKPEVLWNTAHRNPID